MASTEACPYTVLIPSGRDSRETFELSYVPPSKTVLEQAEEELLESRKIHRQFNPALLDGRWSSLWPKTATVITTEALWEKFARQGESPILAGEHVLKAMIRSGVEQGIFGYGLLIDNRRDKLDPAFYEGERVYLGPFDARDLVAVEIGPRGVLMRHSHKGSLGFRVVLGVDDSPRSQMWWADANALTKYGDYRPL